MIDVTQNFNSSDTKLKVKGSKLTRFDLLLNRLEIFKCALNKEKKVITQVYDKSEFVEKVSGTLKDTEEILEYYSPNFVIDLKIKKPANEIIVHLLRPIEKSADNDLVEQYKKNQG